MTEEDKQEAQEAESKVEATDQSEAKSSQPTKMTLEEAIKQKLAQKKQAQANDKFNTKHASGNMNLRNQNSNRNNALGRRNKV